MIPSRSGRASPLERQDHQPCSRCRARRFGQGCCKGCGMQLDNPEHVNETVPVLGELTCGWVCKIKSTSLSGLVAPGTDRSINRKLSSARATSAGSLTGSAERSTSMVTGSSHLIGRIFEKERTAAQGSVAEQGTTFVDRQMLTFKKSKQLLYLRVMYVA